MKNKKTETILEEKKFINDLRTLVELPTVTGQPEGFQEAFEFIKSQIHKDAVITQLENKGETILIASNHITKTPDVCFIVHVDVVTGNPEQFVLKVDGDNAYGRGVSDMKFSIPMGYELLNKLIIDKSKLKFSFVVTSDEERGGFNGAGFLADEYKLRPKVAICPDGGDNFVCINKSKGVFHIRITSKGKPGHASKPWLGHNALEPIVKVLSILINKYKFANSNEGWNTTMNIGLLNGGTLINKIPDTATVDLDFRFVPEKDSFDSLEKMIADVVQTIDPNMQIEILATGEAMFTKPSNPIFHLFMQIMSQHLNKKVILKGEDGSNDARHFNKYGAPVLMSKPEGGDIHGDNEWISISSSLLFAQIIYEFLIKYEDSLAK
jgi:succinyl-diaminopimelate desuccinylase